ncbi:hypothetical protein ACJMK2_037820, partial [Sinanodonta woodiana]
DKQTSEMKMVRMISSALGGIVGLVLLGIFIRILLKRRDLTKQHQQHTRNTSSDWLNMAPIKIKIPRPRVR